jgi:hypothetical protein
MTRMSPKTISEDRSSTGTASMTRRSVYLYIERAPGSRAPYLSSQTREIAGEP